MGSLGAALGPYWVGLIFSGNDWGAVFKMLFGCILSRLLWWLGWWRRSHRIGSWLLNIISEIEKRRWYLIKDKEDSRNDIILWLWFQITKKSAKKIKKFKNTVKKKLEMTKKNNKLKYGSKICSVMNFSRSSDILLVKVDFRNSEIKFKIGIHKKNEFTQQIFNIRFPILFQWLSVPSCIPHFRTETNRKHAKKNNHP